jgi:two-component system sensor histidine kinase BaeS
VTRTLTVRLAGAMALVAALGALLVGILAAPLVRGSTEDAVRQPLGRQAALLAQLTTRGLTSARIDRVTDRAELTVGVLQADGSAIGVAGVLSAAEKDALLAGQPVSTERRYQGTAVLIEARPARGGGAVVLATDAGVVDAASAKLRHRLLLAIVVGSVVAVLVGWAVALWLGRPLAATAAAARRMASGERGVPLPSSTTTEVADLTGALAGLDQALAASEDRQRSFLLSVSHELRTPLTTVRGYAEGLADGVIGADETASVGRTLVEEADRMERYVADLLALARLEADDFSLDLMPVDVAALVGSAAETWRDRAARDQIAVEPVVAAGPLVARVDAARLRQVLDVLMDNATRVCGPGDRIVLAVSAAEGGVRLEVRDSGPGLSPDDAAVAFEPGALRDRYAASRPVGHGLGLAIAHRLVSRMGGRIDVRIAPEGGAAFVIDLPR